MTVIIAAAGGKCCSDVSPMFCFFFQQKTVCFECSVHFTLGVYLNRTVVNSGDNLNQHKNADDSSHPKPNLSNRFLQISSFVALKSLNSWNRFLQSDLTETDFTGSLDINPDRGLTTFVSVPQLIFNKLDFHVVWNFLP